MAPVSSCVVAVYPRNDARKVEHHSPHCFFFSTRWVAGADAAHVVTSSVQRSGFCGGNGSRLESNCVLGAWKNCLLVSVEICAATRHPLEMKAPHRCCEMACGLDACASLQVLHTIHPIDVRSNVPVSFSLCFVFRCWAMGVGSGREPHDGAV